MTPGPTFLVIGAGRSGTTSLHHYLAAHPQVFVPPVKSPSYFYAVDERPDRRRPETDDYFVRDRDAYRTLFRGSEAAIARGEVSPAYLSAQQVVDRIADELPDVHLIAVLRNPTDRCIARFVARRRDGLEDIPGLAEVIEREMSAGLDRDDTAGTYVAAGFVAPVLERYLTRFGPGQVSVFLHDDLVADTAAVVAGVFRAIGVDDTVVVDTTTRHNASGGHVPGVVGAVWRSSARMRRRVRPVVPRRLRDHAFRLVTRRLEPAVVPAETRWLLDELYRDEVRHLGELIGRDLGHWSSGEEHR